MLLVAPSIIWKTNFPRHLRSDATNASSVFSVAESSTKNVILLVRLEETQSFIFSELYYLFLNCGNSFLLVDKFAVLSQLRPSEYPVHDYFFNVFNQIRVTRTDNFFYFLLPFRNFSSISL
jgi:hypothetical protein